MHAGRQVKNQDAAATLKIPEGTQTGTVFRLKGKGIPHLHGYGAGDQHVRVKVETPTRLTEKQKELLRRFAGGGVENAQGDSADKSFFEKMKDAFIG